LDESRRKFIHLGCCTPPDHLSNVNRFHDVLFVSSAFLSFACVILQAGLTVGSDRCANGDQFFDPIIKLHGDLLFPLIQVRFLRTMYDSRAPRLKSVHCLCQMFDRLPRAVFRETDRRLNFSLLSQWP